MEPQKYSLFIDGRNLDSRGLDLACNPYNGKVLGQVVLVSESLLAENRDESEETVRLFLDA